VTGSGAFARMNSGTGAHMSAKPQADNSSAADNAATPGILPRIPPHVPQTRPRGTFSRSVVNFRERA